MLEDLDQDPLPEDQDLHIQDQHQKILCRNEKMSLHCATCNNDTGCINDIHRFMGYLPLVTEIDARRVGFLHRIKSCNNTVMSLLYEVFGKHELQALLSKYDIAGTCSPYRFRFIVHN